MDGTLIALFLIATFFGGLTSGLTGFAAGLGVSGVWLHIITPMQTAVRIATYGVVNQSYGIWKVRRALRWRRILPSRCHRRRFAGIFSLTACPQ
jgi:uncharacterized protein